VSQAYAADPMDEGQETGAPELEAEQPANDARHPLLSLIGVPNLADHLSDDVLGQMGAKVCDEFKLDEDSRAAAGWDETNKAAMDLVMLVRKAKNVPWPNAANVKFPLLIKACIEFNARAYPAIIDGPDVVKGSVKGEPSPEKEARAERIGNHMSYQLLEEMDDWEEDTDKLLIQLPAVGCAFRKSYFDPVKGYNSSHLVSAKDFVVNYMTKDLATCPRATHVLTFYPHEIAEKMRSGLWLEQDLGTPQDGGNDDQAPHTFLEQHRLWDLDGDDYPEPYIVTVHKETQKVVRVVARFTEKGLTLDGEKVVRIAPTRIFTKYPFIPAPDGSFYDMGFGTLLFPLSESINSIINQILDAGTLSNMQAGFIGAGISIKSGSQSFKPGEFKKVEATGSALKDNIVLLPTKEPSAVLFNLLGLLIEAAKDVTATQDILSGDAGKGTLPVGTVTALVEQGLKTFTAIVKRVHRALKKELGVLYDLNAHYLQPQAYFTFQDVQGVIAQQDYAEGDCDVVPVSDPNMATDMQRMQRAQFVMEVGKQTGAVIPRESAKQALIAAKVPDPDKLLPPDGPPPPDPKTIELADKSRQKDRELDQKDIALSHERAEVDSRVELNLASAQNAAMDAYLKGPQFALAVQQALDARLATFMEAQSDQGPTNGGQVQQGEPGNMAGPQGHPPVPPVPQGPAGPPGGAMGFGPGDGPPPPVEGAPPG
jgi:chaperonin GroES